MSAIEAFFFGVIAMQEAKFGFGQSVVRKEDDPLLRGLGRYIADAAPRGHGCLLANQPLPAC